MSKIQPVSQAAWRKAERDKGIVAFCKRSEGSTAIYTAVTMFTMACVLGLGVDTARAFLVKSKLSEALDAAALAGGKTYVISDSNADINMFFNANFPKGYMGATPSVPLITQSGQTVTVSATATLKPYFGTLLGKDVQTVSASTQVTRNMTALDVTLAIDVSGSMGDTIPGASESKISQVKDAATQLVNTLFDGDTVSKTVSMNGQTWNLLNIGLVPFNSKVNVINSDASLSSSVKSTTTNVTSFTNPANGKAQSLIYYATNSSGTKISDVPLLMSPDTNWKGCVYARYLEDSNMANDADLALDTPTLSGAQWAGWQPIPTAEGEPNQGVKNGPACYAAQWNSTTKNTNPTRPNYPYWVKANPTISSSSDCTACPAQGITKLQTKSTTITNAIATLSAGGNTNITQGLYWAYEILMHGSIFTQSAANPPFPRDRAVVLLTDGENVGGNGDAYKGVFGSGTNAGTLSNHGTLSNGKPNNLNNRLLQLATDMKTTGAVRIYVIQFNNPNQNTTALLQQVASGTTAPFYFNAPTGADLQDAFQKITADLSKLRISE